LQDFLALEDQLMEAVVFILFDFHAILYKLAMEGQDIAVRLVTRHVAVSKRDFIKLLYVLNVIDREALFELFRELLHMLSVTERQHNSRYVVIFASSKLFPHSTDADNFTKRSDFSCHRQISSYRLSRR